jgi:hypothetical protein
MALVDHEGNAGALLRAGVEDLVKDAENLIGVDGAEGQVVVRILAVVEVESTECSEVPW